MTNSAYFKLTLAKFFQEKKFLKKFLIVFFTYFLGMFSIFKAYTYYQQDILFLANPERYQLSDTGYAFNWLLQRIFSFSNYAQDISPLPQILSLVVLTLASLISVKVFLNKLSYIPLVCSVVLGLSPYFLQNLSSKFFIFSDSFALLCAVIPFLFGDRFSLFLRITFFSSLIIFNSYTPAISVFLIFYVYIQLHAYLTDTEADLNDIFYHLFRTIFSITCAFGLTLLINHFLNLAKSSYTFEGQVIFQTLKNAFSFTIGHWQNPLGFFYLILVFFFAGHLLLTALKANNSYGFLQNILFTVSCLCTLFILPFLTILYTTSSSLVPKNLAGFGGLIFVMIFSLFQIKIYYRIKYVFYFLGLSIFWGTFIFAINYGNLLITQKHYEVFKLEAALSDLAKHPYKKIVFSGPKIRTPVVVEKAKEYPLLAELIYTSQNDKFLEKYVMSFMVPYLKRCPVISHLRTKKVLEDNKGHTLTLINNTCVEISLKQNADRDPHKRY